MIVDLIIGILASVLLVVGLWLLWNVTIEAWDEWRNS